MITKLLQTQHKTNINPTQKQHKNYLNTDKTKLNIFLKYPKSYQKILLRNSRKTTDGEKIKINKN